MEPLGNYLVDFIFDMSMLSLAASREIDMSKMVATVIIMLIFLLKGEEKLYFLVHLISTNVS